MSGQWETVGRKKDKKSNLKDLKESTTLKKATLVPNTNTTNVKLDEILNKAQMKNLYSNNNDNENRNERRVLEASVTSTTITAKKSSKKQEKVQEVAKPKQAKSIESALNSINVDDFSVIFETSKTRFPDAPIVWLKELAQFLNQKIHVDVQDCVFSTRPYNYPYSVVPTGIKNILEKALKLAGKNNVQVFFDICLTSMATEMSSKNLPCLGYKLFLQYIVEISNDNNNIVLTKLNNKYLILRNSYQNRPNIGLSILWSIGQYGYKDFNVGIQIFQQLMLPLIELKHYSRFVIKYLINLIKVHRQARTTIRKDDLVLILDVIFVNRKNFPNDLKQELISIYNNDLKLLLFNHSVNNDHTIIVEYLLRQLPTISNNKKQYQDCLCDLIVGYCSNDSKNLEFLSKLYRKNIYSFSILLNYIVRNWKTISTTQLNLKILANILNDFNEINCELDQKKRREDGLAENIATIKKLQKNLMEKKKSSKSPLSLFKFLLLLTTLVAATFVYFDIKQNNNNWKETRTRKFLVDSGLCGYCRLIIDQIKIGLGWIDEKIDNQFPGYQKIVIEFSEPYMELFRNLGIIFYNLTVNLKEAFIEKYPRLVQSVENYVPDGVVETSKNLWTASIFYLNCSVDYLKNEVFVGQLSPENMHRVVIEAINTTQTKATEYYHWLYEKVQTTIK